MYSIVIPCYNEEYRLPSKEILEFTLKHCEINICLVNDGSRDNTLIMLHALCVENPKQIQVLNLPNNLGKSEAVRLGMLHALKNSSSEIIGFLDADLATRPEEWLEMAKYKERNPKFAAIIGSRIQRLGTKISRSNDRSFFSSIVKFFIKLILRTELQDTQCGAKMFQRDLIPFIFHDPFLSAWLFDIEIFLRIQNKFGPNSLQKGVLEYPLMEWNEIGQSKLKWKDKIMIPYQLLSLCYHYKIRRWYLH